MTGSVFLGTTQLSIREPDGEILVPILRTGDLSGGVQISFGTSERAAGPDSATSGIDFVSATGSVVMQPGQDRVVVPVTILDDPAAEASETFVFSITSVHSLDVTQLATILAPRTALVDILDDENPVLDPPDPPVVSDYTVTEQTILAGMSPIALEFAPGFGGKQIMYVADKDGIITGFDLGTSASIGTFADLSEKVNSAHDRGLFLRRRSPGRTGADRQRRSGWDWEQIRVRFAPDGRCGGQLPNDDAGQRNYPGRRGGVEAE